MAKIARPLSSRAKAAPMNSMIMILEGVPSRSLIHAWLAILAGWISPANARDCWHWLSQHWRRSFVSAHKSDLKYSSWRRHQFLNPKPLLNTGYRHIDIMASSTANTQLSNARITSGVRPFTAVAKPAKSNRGVPCQASKVSIGSCYMECIALP